MRPGEERERDGFATPGEDPAPKPPPTGGPCHLLGGQQQVADRLRLREHLDLLRQMRSVVPTPHGLVQGPRGCGERQQGLSPQPRPPSHRL